MRPARIYPVATDRFLQPPCPYHRQWLDTNHPKGSPQPQTSKLLTLLEGLSMPLRVLPVCQWCGVPQILHNTRFNQTPNGRNRLGALSFLRAILAAGCAKRLNSIEPANPFL